MKRRVISVLLCVLMLSALAIPAFAEEIEPPYDLEDDFVPRPGGDDWECDFVERPGCDDWECDLIEEPGDDDVDAPDDWIVEEDDTESRSIPAGNATRAEAMALLLRAREPTRLTSSANTPDPNFPDVQRRHWFYPVAGWAR